ncbi:hypothetical protein [Paenibacillus oleatilyticus]|uniref:hypothetical protein n=1 Tax=Paenibacillus oleatilyticus TaxID=2594886 RepID=UPI001C1FC73B|nr:hypothetical protein [Paenibacillus oleatilyticus]MBU7320274.1 hypothetical protein [Paenibacillus oleatilyticus]
MASNRVIAGDYKGKVLVSVSNVASMSMGFLKRPMDLTSDTVESYEVLDESTQKGALSTVGRAAAGGLLLGPFAAVIGGMTGRNNRTHIVAIQFKDGKRSLLEIDDKVYKALVTGCFK